MPDVRKIIACPHIHRPHIQFLPTRVCRRKAGYPWIKLSWLKSSKRGWRWKGKNSRPSLKTPSSSVPFSIRWKKLRIRPQRKCTKASWKPILGRLHLTPIVLEASVTSTIGIGRSRGAVPTCCGIYPIHIGLSHRRYSGFANGRIKRTAQPRGVVILVGIILYSVPFSAPPLSLIVRAKSCCVGEGGRP
jgi:hypothetical protein